MHAFKATAFFQNMPFLVVKQCWSYTSKCQQKFLSIVASGDGSTVSKDFVSAQVLTYFQALDI